MTPSTSLPFITCGMYAFTDDLQRAWQMLFDHFIDLTKDQLSLDPGLLFETDELTLRNANLFLGHTCGYPLMKNLQDALIPVCLPIFDVPGSEGKNYSSVFITSFDSNIKSLQDCHQRVVAVNGTDSNSGMNVLRHAIAPLSLGKPFFSSVIVSGSHKNSVLEVGEGRADIAAIDSVSFALIADAWPELAAKVSVIGYSARTCGLPLVMPKSRLENSDSKMITAYLNQALQKLPEELQQRLHLKKFSSVDLSEYQGILDIEQQAREAGYDELA